MLTTGAPGAASTVTQKRLAATRRAFGYISVKNEGVYRVSVMFFLCKRMNETIVCLPSK